MNEVIIIVGLPGSGKTTYAKQLDPEGFRLFDDAARSPRGIKDLTEHLQQGGNALLTDVYALTEPVRSNIEQSLYQKGAQVVRWRFFENDPEACILNIRRRNLTETRFPTVSEDAVRHMATTYEIPFGVPARPVFKEK